ncbi:MAG TPA: MAPEG family protein, partial [Steroidobacteraceae bacterium]|nr:MAPEG family protein [Steroidobacteraceae bacterium]
RARGKYGVHAPAITGHPVFERTFRVQQNTLELLIIFVPAIALFGTYISWRWGALLGLLFILGRAVYAVGYIRAPEKREIGASLSFAANAVLLLGALYGAIRALLR